MRVRLILAAFAAVLCTSFARADDAAPSPSFHELKAALAFIDTALDNDDWGELTQALYPPFQPGDPNRVGWKQLKDERGKLRLVTVFKNGKFPSASDTLVIGSSPFTGSTGMKGWSRIRFIKTDDGWHLNAIYGVR